MFGGLGVIYKSFVFLLRYWPKVIDKGQRVRPNRISKNEKNHFFLYLLGCEPLISPWVPKKDYDGTFLRQVQIMGILCKWWDSPDRKFLKKVG